jgi:teichuronic acid biosynthesis protein TuaE
MQSGMKGFGWEQSVICAFPVTAALGPNFPSMQVGGISLSSFRLLVGFTIGCLMLSGKGLIFDFDSSSKGFFRCGLFWVGWGLCALIWGSIIWGLHFDSSFLEVMAVAFGFLAGVVLLNLVFRTRNGLEALRLGWVLAFVASAIIAAWEFRTGSHLPGYQESLDAPALGLIVFSTFGNPNNYAAFLALCFPFLIWSVRSSRGWRKCLYLFLTVSLPPIAMLTMGRLGLFAILLECVLLSVLGAYYSKRILTGLLAVAGLSIALAVSAVVFPASFEKILSTSEDLGTIGQGGDRLNLVRNGLVFFERSYGAGVGPANFEHMMLAGQGPYATQGDVNPHNFWIEIASEYGLLVLLFFVAWLIFGAKRIWKAHKAFVDRGDLKSQYAAEAMLLGLTGYVFAAMENSSYITQQSNWAFLASVLAVSCWICRSRQTV